MGGAISASPEARAVQSLIKQPKYPVELDLGIDFFPSEFTAQVNPGCHQGYDSNIRSASALFSIGVKFELGVVVAEDFVEAARCYRRAAEQGHAVAQFNLGSMYTKGRGVEIDHAQAVRWYLEAARQGLPHAQCNLGNIYLQGLGVEKDWVIAMKWFKQSAAQGHKKATDAIAFMAEREAQEPLRPSFDGACEQILI